MKKIVAALVLSLVGAFAHAQSEDIEMQGGDASINGRIWACGLAFQGSSKGVKVIIGHFSTVAYGTLSCKGLLGKHYTQKVKLTIGHHWLSPVVGIGYFKMAGISSEISLFNSSPDVLLGKYKVVQTEAAVGGGVGVFTAAKVGLPQLAFNISLQLLKGIGAQVGVDKLVIEAID